MTCQKWLPRWEDMLRQSIQVIKRISRIISWDILISRIISKRLQIPVLQIVILEQKKMILIQGQHLWTLYSAVLGMIHCAEIMEMTSYSERKGTTGSTADMVTTTLTAGRGTIPSTASTGMTS